MEQPGPFSPDDIFWMRRCFQLALPGAEKAAPNPLVGCVLVHPQHGFLGEGGHTGFGKPHAEVEAVASVSDPALLEGATAYVNLEPCSHFGKTPPCADLLIRHKIGRVVVANPDPHPLVAGKGFQKLREAGIEVQAGLLQDEGWELNRFFFTAVTKKRPWITLKWAQSADGFLAPVDRRPLALTGEATRVLVHKQRAAHQSILVGRETWRRDQPALNLRSWQGRAPIRLVHDPELKLPLSENLAAAETWILNTQKEGSEGHISFRKGPFDDRDPRPMLQHLWESGIHSLYVEGGAHLHQLFLEWGLWDEIQVFTAPIRLGAGLSAPVLPSGLRIRAEKWGPDFWETFRPLPASAG